MFLNEVALGKEYTITRDDSNLRKAPNGYDSVVARGTQEPGQCPFHIEVLNAIFSITKNEKNYYKIICCH